MAFTISHLAKNVMGNQRVHHMRVTADAATDAFQTGLGVIEAVQLAPQSMTSAAAKLKINVLSAGTAANGYLAVTGVASGDVMFITVYGK